MTDTDEELDALLIRAGAGESAARHDLLARHRDRLRRMIALRMDRRLAARIDASDVVQEVMAAADRELPGFLARRDMPFYAWLRRFAWDRLIDLHRRHVLAKGRSVGREEALFPALPDPSALALADRLAATGTSPSEALIREESRRKVRDALECLPERDREVLVLLYMEELSAGEIAAILGSTAGAVRVRHLRALERLRKLIPGAGPVEGGR